eukprot:COSAG05_NODE_7970_length_750_cov_1.436252_1_plen_185_part_10
MSGPLASSDASGPKQQRYRRHGSATDPRAQHHPPPDGSSLPRLMQAVDLSGLSGNRTTGPTPVPAGEASRLDTLKSLGVLDQVLPQIDPLVREAARIFDAPISAVSLVDADRQVRAAASGWLPVPRRKLPMASRAPPRWSPLHANPNRGTVVRQPGRPHLPADGPGRSLLRPRDPRRRAAASCHP